jgi:hypothetical protein
MLSREAIKKKNSTKDGGWGGVGWGK